MRKALKAGIGILRAPHKEFSRLRERELETVLYRYLWMLLFLGIATAIFRVAYYVGRALFYDLIRELDVQYWRLLNYGAGEAVAALFFTLFAGTFILFAISMIIGPFVKVKYIELLKLLFVALTPVLLFGWFSIALPGLFVWTFILLITGTQTLMHAEDRIKGTIKQRE